MYWTGVQIPIRAELCFKISASNAPLTSSCPGRKSLCLASMGDHVIPHSCTATKQHRAFLVAGPTIWNNFPPLLRSLPHDLTGSFCKDFSFCPGLGWELLCVVPLKEQYINLLDRWILLVR